VLSVRIIHLVKLFLLQACMPLFPTLAEYFMYSHFPISCIMLLCPAAQEMRNTLMKIFSRRVKPPVICLWQDGVLSAT
jgi:hypothetical protein